MGLLLCQSLVPQFPLFFLFHLPSGISERHINETNALPSAWGFTCMVGSRGKDACVNTVSSEASFIDPVHVAVWGESIVLNNVGRLHSACKLHPSWGQGMRLLAKNPGHKVQNDSGRAGSSRIPPDQFSLPPAPHRNVRIEVEGSLAAPSQVPS